MLRLIRRGRSKSQYLESSCFAGSLCVFHVDTHAETLETNLRWLQNATKYVVSPKVSRIFMHKDTTDIMVAPRASSILRC